MTLAVVARLARPAGMATVWSGALAGSCLAGPPISPAALAALAVAMSLAYFAGTALNDAYDAPLDFVLRPERPIPRGEIRRGAVLALGYAALAAFVVMVAGLAWWRGNPGSLAAAGAALVLAGTIVLYNTAHEGNPAAPALLAACRGLVYVTAALAVSGRLSWLAALGAAVIAAYALGLFYCRLREDSARFWAPFFLFAPFLATAPLLVGPSEPFCLWFFTLVWVARCVLGLARRDFRGAGRGLLAALCLVDALLIAQRGPSAAVWAAAAGFPLTLLSQRWADAAHRHHNVAPRMRS